MHGDDAGAAFVCGWGLYILLGIGMRGSPGSSGTLELTAKRCFHVVQLLCTTVYLFFALLLCVAKRIEKIHSALRNRN